MLRPLVAATLAAGALLATPASADAYCFGSNRYYYVCAVVPPLDPGNPLPLEEIEVYCGGSLCPGTDRAGGA